METQHSRKLTYDDFVQLPDDNLRHEIIDGEHYVTPAPSARHQRVLGRLYRWVGNFLETHPGGEAFLAPFDVVLSRHDVVEPDMIYVRHEGTVARLTEKNLQGPPDLVVEILSPSTRGRDERLKRDRYERTGVLEYWLVDPDQNQVVVYRRGERGFDAPNVLQAVAGDMLTTRLLPGFEASLERLFG